MAKRSRLERKKPVGTLDDLLSAWQEEWLAKERLLWKRMFGEFARLRSSPYPLGPCTADLVEYLGAQYALPWQAAQVEFARWLYPGFRERAVRLEAEFNGLPVAGSEEQFGSLDLVEWFGLSPVIESLRDDEACEFDDECAEYEQALRASLKGTELLRKCVRMPWVPLGGVMLSFLPLLEGVWIDAEAITVCEACARLVGAGHVRLEPDDSHPLSWHRWYPKGTWWGYPKLCLRDVFLDAVEQAGLSLVECPARTREVSGRLHIDFGAYLAWEGRGIPGDLGAGVFDGLWLEGWNAWAEDPAVQKHGLAGLPVAPLTHPCRFERGRDFERFSTPGEAESALTARRQGFDGIRSIAMAEAGKEALANLDAPDSPRFWPFSPIQKKILRVLEGSAMGDIELALKLEREVVPERQEDDDDRPPGKLRTLYREVSLLIDMGLVANDRTRGGYYRPDRPPSPRG